jgi:hypothetical protein
VLPDEAVAVAITDSKDVTAFEFSRENKYTPREGLRKTLFADPLADLRRSAIRQSTYSKSRNEPLSTLDSNVYDVYDGLEEQGQDDEYATWKTESLDDLSARVDPDLLKSMCDDLGVDPCLIAGYEPPPALSNASEAARLSDFSDEEDEPAMRAATVRLVVAVGPKRLEVMEPPKKQPLTKEEEEEQARKQAARGEEALRMERRKLAKKREGVLQLGRNKRGYNYILPFVPVVSCITSYRYAESIVEFSRRVRQVNQPPPKPMLPLLTKPKKEGAASTFINFSCARPLLTFTPFSQMRSQSKNQAPPRCCRGSEWR